MPEVRLNDRTPRTGRGLLLVILREVNIIRRNDPRIVGDLLDIALNGVYNAEEKVYHAARILFVRVLKI